MSIKNNKKLILSKIKAHYGYRSDSDFASFLGIKPTTLSSWYSRNTFDFELLYSKCVDINPEFFFTGNGEMLKGSQKGSQNESKTKNAKNVTLLENPEVSQKVSHLDTETKNAKNRDTFNEIVNDEKGKEKGKDLGDKPNMQESLPFSIIPFKLRTDKNRELQVIPIYSMEASAGLVQLLDNPTIQIPVDYISIPNLPNCDGAMFVTGDSMYPLLKSGDIVAYKQIRDLENDIFYGEMYLISVEVNGEELVTVKYIQKSDKEGYINLVSQNKHHSDKVVRLTKVRALALVKASIRYNVMY